MDLFTGGGEAKAGLSIHASQSESHMGGAVSAILSLDDIPQVTHAAFIPHPKDIVGRRNAFIRCDDCDLESILHIADANYYAVDPSPDQPGRYVWRHPVFLVGAPQGLPIEDVRRIAHLKYPYVSADAPEWVPAGMKE